MCSAFFLDALKNYYAAAKQISCNRFGGEICPQVWSDPVGPLLPPLIAAVRDGPTSIPAAYAQHQASNRFDITVENGGLFNQIASHSGIVLGSIVI
ncbi:hypothetical protein RB195_004883 [Necator americanus]|uniref:Uncharacterized protein n=1 Tax=Necator americanus TaxID=51031 RepID=A0ABR1BN84_NECAM